MASVMFRRHMRVEFIVPIKWGFAEFTHRMPHKTTSLALASIDFGITCAYVLTQLCPSIEFLLTYKNLPSLQTEAAHMQLMAVEQVPRELAYIPKPLSPPRRSIMWLVLQLVTHT